MARPEGPITIPENIGDDPHVYGGKVRRRVIDVTGEVHPAVREAVLKLLAKGGSWSFVSSHMRSAGYNYSAKKWQSLIKRDPLFAEQTEVAIEAFAAKVLERAHHVAIDGVERYAINGKGIVRDENGEPVINRHYDTKVLLRLLERHLPEYQATQNINVNRGEESTTADALVIRATDLYRLSASQRNALMSIVRTLAKSDGEEQLLLQTPTAEVIDAQFSPVETASEITDEEWIEQELKP